MESLTSSPTASLTASPPIVLRNFWASLYQDADFVARYTAYYAAILRDVAPRYTRVEVWSVFGPPLDRAAREPGVLYVQFSGEPYYLDLAAYDLNLVPAAPGPGVVPHLFAAKNWHVQYAAFPHAARCFDGRPGGVPLAERGFCAFVVSNGSPDQARVRFLRKLQAYKPVHSCGRYANTTGWRPPADEGTPAYLDFLGHFKFVICFENARRDHYLTEKLMNAYMAGCVPIYWGCPQAAAVLNAAAFLTPDDPAPEPEPHSLDRLVDAVRALDADDAAWTAVHMTPLFKNKALPPEFELETIRAAVRASFDEA